MGDRMRVRRVLHRHWANQAEGVGTEPILLITKLSFYALFIRFSGGCFGTVV